MGIIGESKLHPHLLPRATLTAFGKFLLVEPALLLGHTYTRYMGDLSENEMLQKVA